MDTIVIKKGTSTTSSSNTTIFHSTIPTAVEYNSSRVPLNLKQKISNTMQIRDFKYNDLNIMQCWLQQEYIKTFWGDPEDWIKEITENLDADWVKYFIVECDAPIGFLQYYETDKAPQGEWSLEPKGTVGIDYLIGAMEYLGKGYGSVMVRQFIEQIRSLGKYEFIIADPIKENVSSIKVLTTNGFELQQNGFYKLRISFPQSC